MYGHEDWLLHAAAQYPHLFKLNNGRTRFLPVHVTDVATALEVMLNAPVTSGASTFALPGPIAYTHDDILRAVSFFTMKPKADVMSIPKPIAMLLASFFNRALWWPTMSPDEVERRYIDDIGVDQFYKPEDSARPDGWDDKTDKFQMYGVNGEPVKTWSDLNIEPTLLEETAIRYLRRYRTSCVFPPRFCVAKLIPSGATTTSHWRWETSRRPSHTTLCHKYALPSMSCLQSQETGIAYSFMAPSSSTRGVSSPPAGWPPAG